MINTNVSNRFSPASKLLQNLKSAEQSCEVCSYKNNFVTLKLSGFKAFSLMKTEHLKQSPIYNAKNIINSKF